MLGFRPARVLRLPAVTSSTVSEASPSAGSCPSGLRGGARASWRRLCRPSTGGRPPYGFRRWLASESGTPARPLADGEVVKMARHHVLWLPSDDEQEWATLRNIRDQVLKSLEEARNQKHIGKSLEAQVKLNASDALYSTLERHKDELRYLFIVSAVTVEKSASGNGTNPLTIEVSKAAGEKCERCWNYSTLVGEDKQYPTVCERCSAVLKQLESGDK